MQERYLGDIHDYFKFLFLKYLSINLNMKIGLNWFLVNPMEISLTEMAKNDGEKRRYLEKSEFLSYDLKIIKELSEFKDRKKRKIKKFSRSTSLIKYINFYDEYIDYKNRDSWLTKSLSHLKDEKIIFLDPDNGFSNSKKGKSSMKYVLPEDCELILQSNKIVIFTQFQSFNKKNTIYLKEIYKNLKKFNLNPVFPIIRNRTPPNTFFITLLPKKNKINLSKIFHCYAINNSKVEIIRSL